MKETHNLITGGRSFNCKFIMLGFDMYEGHTRSHEHCGIANKCQAVLKCSVYDV
jgi:hypothetical protein